MIEYKVTALLFGRKFETTFDNFPEAIDYVSALVKNDVFTEIRPIRSKKGYKNPKRISGGSNLSNILQL